MNEPTQPRYFKDGAGFCYAWAPGLAVLGMAPWDGEVDARGYAAHGAPEEKPASRQARAPRQAAKDVQPVLPE